MRFPIALLMLCGLTHFASAEPTLEIRSDLDGDGTAEVFALVGDEDGDADLLITTPKGQILAPDIAWKGGMFGQEPDLSLAPNGSLRLTSRNDSIGRNRWELILTIAYRKDAYRVAGFTYSWRDTLDLDAYGICDVNLLNGRGFLTVGNADPKPVRTPLRAPTVTDWDNAAIWDGVCEHG